MSLLSRLQNLIRDDTFHLSDVLVCVLGAAVH